MTDMRALFERQAEWQRQRAKLTWSEKVRMAAAVRESTAQFARERLRIAPPDRQDPERDQKPEAGSQ